MGDYTAFVVSAYAVAFGTVLALVAWVVLGRRAANRALARAERAANREGRR
jgi:heme exporter protein CcmD